MSSLKTEIDASARSPFAGCAILIAAVAVMLFLIIFSTSVLFRQYNEIAKFTGDKPAPVAVTPLDDREHELNTLAERLETFRQQLGENTETSLALTPDEMNLAIAAYEPFKELRGTFRILSAEKDTLRIAISFQLNGKPRRTREDEQGWITSDARYLNGTLISKPTLLKREVVLKLDGIEVADATVAREFIEQMSPYRITERYLGDAVLGSAMAKLTRVAVADGKLVLTRVPGETPSDLITNAQVDSASSRMFTVLGIIACIFLVFAGTVVFVGLRARGRTTGKP